MSNQPRIIRGYKGVDVKADEYVLGQEKPNTSAMSVNYRADRGVREVRDGMTPTLDFSLSGQARKGGVYFPRGANGVIPLTVTDLTKSFYVCSEKTTPASTGYHYTFTVEFWYKMNFHYEQFDIVKAITLHNTLYEHLQITFIPEPVDEGTGSYQLGVNYLTYGDPPGYDRYIQPASTKADIDAFMPADGKWHHVAVQRQWTGSVATMRVVLDGVSQNLTAISGSSTALIGEDIIMSRANTTQKPFMATQMVVGGPFCSMAELRVWRTQRTDSELTTNKDKELLGTETGLVCYCPMNEGTGKIFHEKVNGGQCYLTPQEPWVNDAGELCFTGARCCALPSLRPPYKLPKDPSPPIGVIQAPTNHVDQNENGAYDGGILFDKKINEGTKGATWAEDFGIWHGVAQLRIRLWQLGEGAIAGRLGLVAENLPPAATKYRLMFQGTDDTTPGTFTYFCTAPIVDETWIGVEKTITVFYRGDESGASRVKFYVDDTAQTTTIAVDKWLGSNTLIDTYQLMYEDVTQANACWGAIGGNIKRNNLALAFDLLFLRQWYDDIPDTEVGGVYNEATFIANTWNVNQLPQNYRVFIDEMSGSIASGNNYCTMNDSYPFQYVGGTSQMEQLTFVVMPFHYDTDAYKRNTTSNTWAYLYIDDTTNTNVPNQNVLVRRVQKWRSGSNDQVKLLGGLTNVYKLTDGLLCTGAGEIFFNGCLFSNLVTDLNSNTFKHNVIERGAFEETWFPTMGTTSTLRLMEAVVDDSPVQGIEKFDYATYEMSKYYSFWADIYEPRDELSLYPTVEREKSIYEQRSRKPRWCVGPVKASITPKVRGIFRYTSEDGSVNKLVAAAWSGLYEVSTSTGILIPLEWGFLDRNSDVPVNFTIANNRMLVMDEKSGIKMNYKGKLSRMGVERPTDISIPGICQKATKNIFFQDEEWAYVAQFVDTENGSFSGVIPVVPTRGQSVIMNATGASPNGEASAVQLAIRTAYDYNIDRIRIYRTLDLATNGAPGNLFLITETGRPGEKQDYAYYKDSWEHSNITSNTFLPQEMLGLSTVPKPSKAMAYAHNRVFLLNNEKGRSELTWSYTDYLGLTYPDVFPGGYSLILEGGETSEGTALVWFGGQLIAFKNDSIFRVYESQPGEFSAQIIYKGIGAANQRSVVMAAKSLFHLDQKGLYRYTSGEPEQVSDSLSAYLETLSMDDRDVPFLLFDEANFRLLVFAPSVAGISCDRMVAFNLRDGTYTINHIPEATCGFVDGNDIYIGLANGHIVKFDESATTDIVDYSGTGAVT